MILINDRVVGVIDEVSVANDKEVVRLEFRCKNQVTELFKLTDSTVFINYQNGSTKDRYAVTDLTQDGDYVNFSWTLGANATKKQGKTFFVVCAVITEDEDVQQEWNTELAFFNVNKGLECETQPSEDMEDLFAQLTAMVEENASDITELEGSKQDKLIAGDNITIQGNVISASSSVDAYTKSETDALLDEKQDVLTAGDGISIINDVISASGGMSTITLDEGTDISQLYHLFGAGVFAVSEEVEIDIPDSKTLTLSQGAIVIITPLLNHYAGNFSAVIFGLKNYGNEIASPIFVYRTIDSDVLASYIPDTASLEVVLQSIADTLESKLDTNQGSENAGKVMTVGSDGEVTPQEAQGGPDVVQTTGQNTDKVMSQKAVTDELSGKLSNPLIFTNVSATFTANSDADYSDYSYKAVLTCQGVTASMLATVIFSEEQATSGNYALTCVTGADSVTIYSNDNTAITIPTVIAGMPIEVNVSSGGTSSDFANGASLLCYGQATGAETTEKPDLTTLNTYNEYDEYLSYNHTTKEFTVLQDFNAVITPWVYQYHDSQGNLGTGELYVNNTLIGSRYNTGRQYETSVGGIVAPIQLKAGDTIYVYTPSSTGYPQQRVKITKVNDYVFEHYKVFANIIDTMNFFEKTSVTTDEAVTV